MEPCGWDIFCRMDAHQGQAAWLQAVLTAVAVWLATKLQDRSIAKREEAATRQRLEAAAFAARWAHSRYMDIKKTFEPGPISTVQFKRIYWPEEFRAVLRPLLAVDIAHIADPEVVPALLKVETLYRQMEGDLSELLALCVTSSSSLTKVDLSFFFNKEVDLFNAASSVERVVARKNRRDALM